MALAVNDGVMQATYNGTPGNDTYSGTVNADDIHGLLGNDSLSGNGGNDTLEGNGGADVMSGGDGDDLLYASAPPGAYQTPYYDAVPYVVPVLDRDAIADSLTGGAGDDVISAGYGDNVDGGDGTDFLFISFQGATSSVIFNLSLVSQTIGGGTIQNIEGARWIEGSEFGDVILGEGSGWNGSAPVVFGMGGDDNLSAGYYTAALYGGDGNDSVDGRNSQYLQRVEGGAGNDTLYTNTNTSSVADGGDGDDLIYAHRTVLGGAGNDTILMVWSHYYADAAGGDGDDDIRAVDDLGVQLFGDAGHDTLTGSSITDVLDGGAGNDSVTGGAGQDWLTGGGGNDTLTGGDHPADLTGDVAVYSGGITDYQVTEDALTHIITVADLRTGSPDGADKLDRSIEALQFSEGTYLLDAILAGVGLGGVNFTGDDGADIYVGSEDGNTAIGNGGNDTFNGNGGPDTLIGNDGADQLNGGSSDDVLYAAAPFGVYKMPYYYDFIYIAPILDRDAAADTLTGGAGADLLSAGYGDNVDGGADVDTLFISFQAATAGVSFDLSLTSQTIGGGTIQNIESATWIEGSEFDDVIRGESIGWGDSSKMIFGLGGNDSLVGGSHTRGVYGGAGNDTLFNNASGPTVAEGGDGDDLIYGTKRIYAGAGNDTVQMMETYDDNAAYGGDGNDDMKAAADWASTLYGDAGDDTLTGGARNDHLYGGAGKDSMAGGGGNDRYGVDSVDDVVIEEANKGADEVYSSISYVLGANLEILSLDGSNDIDGTGNGLNNILVGNGANNRLDAGAGNDSVTAGAGADWVSGDAGNDTLEGGAGRDTVSYAGASGGVTVSLSLTASQATGGSGSDKLSGFENLTGSAFADNLTGNEVGNVIIGGASNDTMSGLTGNDSYYVDAVSDAIVELANAGSDAVFSSVSYVLADNLEALTLTGSDHLEATGNAAANGLTGNAGHNLLNGAAGNDTLAGQGGDDTYVVDGSGDVVTENVDEGTDTVRASVNHNLGLHIESLTLTGSGNLSANGNGLANILTGNGGNNALDGGAGDDTLAGGLGDDTYVVDSSSDVIVENASEGTDVVLASQSYTLADHVENLTLTGTADLYGTGNAQGNTITGTSGNNVLIGGAGADTLYGGAGNDSLVTNDGPGPTDSDVDYLYGGDGNDTLAYASFSQGQDVFDGGDGIDTLDYSDGQLRGSFTGIEILYTGGGDVAATPDALSAFQQIDAYWIKLVAGGVIDFSGKQATFHEVWSLTEDNVTVVGTAQDNIIIGNGGNDVLSGGDGNDGLVGRAYFFGVGPLTDNNVLNGDAGNDSLEGSGGNDTINGGTGDDSITSTYNSGSVDVDPELGGIDVIDGGAGWDALYYNRIYGAQGLVYDFGRGATAEGFVATNGTVFRNIEVVELWAGSGNDHFLGGLGSDKVYGGAGADTLSGAAGHDTLIGMEGDDLVLGGAGDDDLHGVAGNDTVSYSDAAAGVTVSLAVNNARQMTGGAGSDFLIGFENLIGSAFNDRLTGDSGDNVIYGGAGGDRMVGGLGNDTYYVDSAGDSVGENHLEGTDTIISSVSYSLLGRAVEILTLTGAGNLAGIGNSLNNLMTGNSGNNTLEGAAGNDMLDGGAGSDRLLGGLGDDTYYVDNAGDSVGENHLEGTDTIISSVSYSLFGRAVENFIMLGSANLSVTGNGLNNTLTGNAGNNALDGGAGSDKMMGGLGDDTYYVDHAQDNVGEAHLQGTDTIYSSVTYSLFGRAVEILTLTGSANLNGTGNSLANSLTGNAGGNRLDGAGGNDVLTGGLGADVFAFMTGSGKDTVTDFSAAQNDAINLTAYTHGVANAAIVSQFGGDVVINLGGGNTITVLSASQTDVLSHMVW
ncbi:hemolysin-type calcium-binding repeat 2 copies family protein [Asticcacaulis biprosthecium C19]|uniref:Hemolysin-type calcium-binding repeat 2 copies family protein n=1 Tax=Asticcacaulis biprosthecium C19 TaxID=715226 RepID=F4QGL1_9CAUL|nr:hemolysin-type calcium-binding repeat 2 copies family protein [Asticcacaulis biprosthecium C19]